MSSNENKSNCVTKNINENATIIGTNVSTQTHISNNKAESSIKSVPSTSCSNTRNIKRKSFQSSQKRDWNLKKRKLEYSKLSSSDNDSKLAVVKQFDNIAVRAQKFELTFVIVK